MNKLALVLALASCSSTKPPADPPTFFTPEVRGVLRGPGASFPIVQYLTMMQPPAPECWTKLVAKIRFGYQLDAPPGKPYFLFEGDLPRDEIESCVRTALEAAIDHDGDLDVIRAGQLGTVYVAWRGSVAIAGHKDQVAHALAAGTPELARTWRDRLAELPPTGPFALWSSDQTVAGLFGVATTNYAFIVDRAEKTPKPLFAGRLVVRYASSDDAQRAQQTIATSGANPALAAPPELADSLKRMRVTRSDAKLEIAFDSDMFAGVDLAMLQRWIGSIQAKQ